MNITTVAYGVVFVGGLALFGFGHPTGAASPSATTPGLKAVAAAAPASPAPTTSPPPAAAKPTVAAATAAPTPSATPAAPATASTSVTGGGMTLTSLAIDLPESDREFPPGPGVEVAQANCAACHSVGMVLNQPALSHATWETEVHKMIAVYKAPVSDDDAKTIVAYLDRIKGAR